MEQNRSQDSKEFLDDKNGIEIQSTSLKNQDKDDSWQTVGIKKYSSKASHDYRPQTSTQHIKQIFNIPEQILEQKQSKTKYVEQHIHQNLKQKLDLQNDQQGINYSQRIYVDAFNFIWTKHGGDFWDQYYMKEKISKFCSKAKKQNIQIKIFIDNGRNTQEALLLYKKRQEDRIRKCNRVVPKNYTQLLGDAFRDEGVEVNYSILDNDDTLASFAHQDNASVLSGDNDFWRYIPLPIRIYKEFHYQNNQLIFIEAEKPTKYIKNQKRNIIVPVPETYKISPIPMVVNYGANILVNPSSQTRYVGNAHLNLTYLREAMYWQLGVRNTIIENIPEWNQKLEKVTWIEQKVTPNEEIINFLNENSAGQIFQVYFPKSSKVRQRPIETTKDMVWNNHLNSLMSLICKIKYFFQPQNKITYSKLLDQYKPTKKYNFLAKDIPEQIKCNVCWKIFNQEDRSYIDKESKHKYLIPKFCNECRWSQNGQIIEDYYINLPKSNQKLIEKQNSQKLTNQNNNKSTQQKSIINDDNQLTKIINQEHEQKSLKEKNYDKIKSNEINLENKPQSKVKQHEKTQQQIVYMEKIDIDLLKSRLNYKSLNLLAQNKETEALRQHLFIDKKSLGKNAKKTYNKKQRELEGAVQEIEILAYHAAEKARYAAADKKIQDDDEKNDSQMKPDIDFDFEGLKSYISSIIDNYQSNEFLVSYSALSDVKSLYDGKIAIKSLYQILSDKSEIIKKLEAKLDEFKSKELSKHDSKEVLNLYEAKMAIRSLFQLSKQSDEKIKILEAKYEENIKKQRQIPIRPILKQTNIDEWGLKTKSHSEIRVSWEALNGIDDVGVPAEGTGEVDSYEISYRQAAQEEWNVPQGKEGHFSTKLTYTAGDLKPNTFYEFRVRAHNCNGWGEFSAVMDKQFVSGTGYVQVPILLSIKTKKQPFFLPLSPHLLDLIDQAIEACQKETKTWKATNRDNPGPIDLARPNEELLSDIKIQLLTLSDLSQVTIGKDGMTRDGKPHGLNFYYHYFSWSCYSTRGYEMEWKWQVSNDGEVIWTHVVQRDDYDSG